MRRRLDGSHKDMPLFLWDKGEKIDLTPFMNSLNGQRHPAAEFRPIEVHFKPDGTSDQRPSLAFVLQGKSGATGYFQLSAEMMKPIFRVLKILEAEADLQEKIDP
jgi:hypothetical protein